MGFFLFQVSDMENILGIVQTENIIVSAEAYNIEVEITPGSICHSFVEVWFYFRM